jgi:hypothetical protein
MNGLSIIGQMIDQVMIVLSSINCAQQENDPAKPNECFVL